MTGEVIDAEAIEEPGTDLAERSVQAATLFRSDDPTVVIERATAAADALADVIRQRGLATNIKGKSHVRVEGWQTLGSMLGVTPVCTWTRPLDNGWEARVEARTLDGRLVGAAEAMCLRSEKRWRTADDYAVRSMAQTRATSKALASPLRFVVTLAGYEGTPAEEMATDTPPDPPSLKERLSVAADQLGVSAGDRKKIAGWFMPDGQVDRQRLELAVERLENNDYQGLMALTMGDFTPEGAR